MKDKAPPDAFQRGKSDREKEREESVLPGLLKVAKVSSGGVCSSVYEEGKKSKSSRTRGQSASPRSGASAKAVGTWIQLKIPFLNKVE